MKNAVSERNQPAEPEALGINKYAAKVDKAIDELVTAVELYVEEAAMLRAEKVEEARQLGRIKAGMTTTPLDNAKGAVLQSVQEAMIKALAGGTAYTTLVSKTFPSNTLELPKESKESKRPLKDRKGVVEEEAVEEDIVETLVRKKTILTEEEIA